MRQHEFGHGDDARATHAPATLRKRLGIALVVSPTIAGVLFGLAASVLVLPRGSVGLAAEVGGLVGGLMFTTTAGAACFVSSVLSSAGPRRRTAAHAR